MVKEMGEFKVFVGGPFSLAVNPQRQFDSDIKHRVNFLIGVARNKGFRVFSSHEREGWGALTDAPERLARIDLHELAESSILLTYWGRIISIGSLLELGVAIDSGKKIVVVREPDVVIASDFYQGVVRLGLINEVIWTTSESVATAVGEFLENFKDAQNRRISGLGD